MINYYIDANIRIKKIANYDKLIKNFSIDKSNQYIEIRYMCGKEEEVPYTRAKYEELDLVQQKQFEKMQEDIYPKLNRHTVGLGSAVTLSSAVAIGNLVIGNPLIAIACLSSTTGGLMQTKCIKIKREMELISWINNNRSGVNQIIKEEVEKLVAPENFDANSINPTIKVYPERDTIYPEEMYYHGINLSNMDQIGLNGLRHLKRKAKKRQRQEKRMKDK